MGGRSDPGEAEVRPQAETQVTRWRKGEADRTEEGRERNVPHGGRGARS